MMPGVRIRGMLVFNGGGYILCLFPFFTAWRFGKDKFSCSFFFFLSSVRLKIGGGVHAIRRIVCMVGGLCFCCILGHR